MTIVYLSVLSNEVGWGGGVNDDLMVDGDNTFCNNCTCLDNSICIFDMHITMLPLTTSKGKREVNETKETLKMRNSSRIMWISVTL